MPDRETGPIEDELIQTFLVDVMRIERKYGFELTALQTERRSRLASLIDRFVDEEMGINETH